MEAESRAYLTQYGKSATAIGEAVMRLISTSTEELVKLKVEWDKIPVGSQRLLRSPFADGSGLEGAMTAPRGV